MRAALLVCLLITIPCLASEDEAWLHRADVPAGTRPLLAVLLDRSAATARPLAAPAPFDPQMDYAVGLADTARCDSTKTYWRRGPGPAPDCHRQAGLDILQCDAALAPLGAYGYFVASPATALECRADDVAPLADTHIFYSGNYLNYLQSAQPPVERPLAEAMAGQLANALAATSGLEVALVVTDDDGPDGGFIAFAPVVNETAAERLRALATTPPAGSAALAESLTEAARWLRGDAVYFGGDSRADPAATDALASGRYVSPFDSACRPVSLGYLSALEASGDEQAPAAADSLARFRDETGGCGDDCLAVLAAWLGTTDLRDDLPGVQSAPVTWLAPGKLDSPADPLAYPNLVATAFQRDAAVAAGPQLSAAAFTPVDAESGELGVIVGLSAPQARARWLGNLFRYGLRAPASPLESPLIVDRDGEPAIDPASGLPFPQARSEWSDAPDTNLLAGGAAGRLPLSDARRIYSNVAGPRLLDAGNALVPGNPLFNRAMLGLGALDPETLDDVLAWPTAQRTLGDTGLHAPIVIDDPATSRVFAFRATQDGLLHAFDAASGVELWAWMPQELLPRLPELLRNAPTTMRSHGIDGALVTHRHDPDGDGRFVTAASEHRWLLFGLGRGGSRYYALDLQSVADPRVLWSFELPDREVEARGEPVVTRLGISGSGQSAGDWIVLLPGGYDTRFDAPAASGTGAGNLLLAVDAATGRELWSAGGGESTLAMPGFASLPTAPRALDLDGDGYLDRAYVIDVTGNLWRIDFRSGSVAAELAGASRIAQLGTGAHRFFATPDVSVTQVGGETRLAIAVGSGSLTRPRDTTVVDRVYVIFDSPAGAAASEVVEDDLYDATDAADALPPDAPGWFVRLESHGPGEKVIGGTVTFDHGLHFQTYQPLAPDATAPCGPPRSAARRYALDVRTALPRETAVDSEEDEPEEVAASGLPPGLRFGFPGPWESTCDNCLPRPFGIVGGATFDPGYAGDPVRTSWRKLIPPPASP